MYIHIFPLAFGYFIHSWETSNRMRNWWRRGGSEQTRLHGCWSLLFWIRVTRWLVERCVALELQQFVKLVSRTRVHDFPNKIYHKSFKQNIICKKLQLQSTCNCRDSTKTARNWDFFLGKVSWFWKNMILKLQRLVGYQWIIKRYYLQIMNNTCIKGSYVVIFQVYFI